MNCQRKILKEMDFLFNASKAVFLCLNTVSVCASEAQYYCKCHLFSGCESYVSHRGYCFACRICIVRMIL